MVRAIREGARNPYVIERARKIVNRVPGHDYAGQTQAIWDYFTGLNGVPYCLDPVDVELVQGGPTLPTAGDCDCLAVQAGMHLEAVGHPTELLVMSVAGPNFHHVCLRDLLVGKTFDLVLNRPVLGQLARVGDELPHALELRRRVNMPQPQARISLLSDKSPLRAAEEARERFRVRAGRGRGTDFGMDNRPQLSGLFEDIVGGIRAIGREIDPTNKNKPLGAAVRGAINSVPGVGPGIVAAADSVAALRKAVSAPGVDPSQLSPQQAAAADAALEAGKAVKIDTGGTVAKVTISEGTFVPTEKATAGGLSTGAKVGLAAGGAAALAAVVALAVKGRKGKRAR